VEIVGVEAGHVLAVRLSGYGLNDILLFEILRMRELESRMSCVRSSNLSTSVKRSLIRSYFHTSEESRNLRETRNHFNISTKMTLTALLVISSEDVPCPTFSSNRLCAPHVSFHTTSLAPFHIFALSLSLSQ